jgi:hypothetical protein
MGRRWKGWNSRESEILSSLHGNLEISRAENEKQGHRATKWRTMPQASVWSRIPTVNGNSLPERRDVASAYEFAGRA